MVELSEPKLDGLVPPRLKPRSAKIVLEGLEVTVDIGFHEFEIGSPQRMLVAIEVWLEKVPPADCDDPAFAWNYDHLREQVEELAKARRYNLQETFAHAIYERVAAMRGVRALRVAINKPDVYRDARAVGVELASFNGASPDG
jgi:7,8-dihydroneopterin aldolase/epimerase/oxygenase